MPTGDTITPFLLGAWLVEPDLNRLSDGDRVVALETRLMGVLTCLASRPGKIFSTDELLDSVWSGRAHADNTIYQAVADLRKVLGDVAHQPRYIETIPKKGYRLICPVMPDAAHIEGSEIAVDSPTAWRRKGLIFVASAVVASICVALVLMAKPELRDQLMPTNEGPRERSVAVLPFVDMSEEGDQQYLGNGIAEELIHMLSNLPDMHVTARTSSFAFRDSNEDIRQIGSKLNVATILEGSIRKDSNRIYVRSQLVDTQNGYHLWSQSFNRRTTDLFNIQNEIAFAVADSFDYRELEALATDDHAARPIRFQAFDLYLLGYDQLRKSTPSSLMLAIQQFERAIEIDPSFALAYAGLSHSYAARYWSEEDQELLGKAESAAEYAVLLDDQSMEAYMALGTVRGLTRDFSGAEVMIRKAIALGTQGYAQPYLSLAFMIGEQGREEAALEIVKNALEHYPMSGRVNHWLGRYYSTMPHGDWDLAFKYFKQAMRAPGHRSSYGAVGRYYLRTGRLDQAISYFSRIVDLTTGPTKVGLKTELLASTYVDIGDHTSAAILIRRSKVLEPDHFGVINSEIHLQLARRDFSAVRDTIHRLLPAHIDKENRSSLMAFYEMVIGDTDHAEEIYARLAATSEPSGVWGEVNLYRSDHLVWGMLGAVNLAYLHKINGDMGTARELLVKARGFIQSKSDYLYYPAGIRYVLAQIAAVEGNNDVAIDYVREAVEAGWAKPWFGRIDPIMADLRKDARYMQILEELEEKLLGMREHPKMLASNEP